MEYILVKPNSGKRVLDPNTKIPIPETGREVPNTDFWRRRIASGDVLKIGQKPAEPKPQKKQTKEETNV